MLVCVVIQFMVSQNMNLKSGGNVTAVGVNLSAENNINIKSSDKVYMGTAVGYNTTTTTRKSKGGWFSGSSTTTTSTSIPVFLQSELKAKRFGINSKSIHIKGLKAKTDSVKLKAEEEIIMDSQTANMTQSVHRTSSSMFTKTSQGSGNSQEVEARTHLDVNKITANQKIKFINTDWDRAKTEIVGDFEEITKSLKSDSYSYSKSSGLGSGKILPVIALAITLACQQYQFGASFLSSLGASGTVLKMGIAGLSVLTTQAATNFIQTGDPVQVFKNLASDRSLRQVAISVATAGIMDKVGGSLGLNLDPKTNLTLMDMGKVNLIKTGIKTAIELPISKQDPQSIVKDNLLGGVADTVGGYFANQIGKGYLEEKFGYTAHKVLHGINGGVVGYLVNSSREGMLSGALGAVATEMIGEGLSSSITQELRDKEQEYLDKGIILSNQEKIKIVDDLVARDFNISKLSSSAIAALVNLNPELSFYAGDVAGSNNLLQFIPATVWASYLCTCIGTSWTYLTALDIYRKHGKEETLNYLASQGIITVATGSLGWVIKGITYTSSAQAWQALKSSIPAFKDVLKTGKINFGGSIKNWFKGGKEARRHISHPVLDNPRIGSALKKDLEKPIYDKTGKIVKEFPATAKSHGFNDIIDNYAGKASKFDLDNGKAILYQIEGFNNGKVGRFEWIVQDSKVTHRMFIEGGSVNGLPVSK
jgi:Possible hemagglutinin (DUF637)